MITVTIYKGRDNPVSLGLKTDGALENITSFTRVTLQVGDVTLDSRINTTTFDWTTNGATGQLDLDIGMENDLKVGKHIARLTIYDATYTNGLVWGNFVLNVEDPCQIT